MSNSFNLFSNVENGSANLIEGFSYQTKKDTKQKIRVQILSHPGMIRPFRNFIYEISLVYNILPEKAFDLKIIASEVLNILIQKRKPYQYDLSIFFEYLFYTTYVEMRFRDFLVRFTKEETISRDLAEFRESGISFYLISSLSDYHFWEELDQKGVLMVIKKRIGG